MWTLTIGIKWKIPDPVSVPTAKPIKALRIHLKADFFRNGKITAPPKAEQLITVTAINPTRISIIKF